MNSLKVIFDFDTWQEIFGSIAKNKTRTIITVVGVLWGIFIYITLSGAAKGLDNGFEREFQGMAMNSMFVWPQRTSVPYAGFKVGRYPRFTISNVKDLKRQIPEIRYIAPRNARGYLEAVNLPVLFIRKYLVLTISMEIFQSIQK